MKPQIHVDDRRRMCLGSLKHGRQKCADHVKHGRDIEREGAIPILRIDGQNATVVHDTRTVEQRIQCFRAKSQFAYGIGVAHIQMLAADKVCQPVFTGQRFQVLERVVVDIGSNNLGTGTCAGQYSGAAYALGRSGNEDGFALQA